MYVPVLIFLSLNSHPLGGFSSNRVLRRRARDEEKSRYRSRHYTLIIDYPYLSSTSSSASYMLFPRHVFTYLPLTPLMLLLLSNTPSLRIPSPSPFLFMTLWSLPSFYSYYLSLIDHFYNLCFNDRLGYRWHRILPFYNPIILPWCRWMFISVWCDFTKEYV